MKTSLKKYRKSRDMAAPFDVYKIRNALERAISEALNESSLNIRIEMPELNAEGETYSVKGNLAVIPWLTSIVKRKGKFEAKLDKNLNIINLKITEEAH